jgi:hypothetical protein
VIRLNARALVTAMAGTSYAAVAITGKDVKNSSLTALDFKAGQLPRGATGATGAAGAVGPQGARGPAGPTRWLLVNAAGQIEAQSGGFAVAAPYPETPAAANGNVYINADEDLADNGIHATLALQNQVNQEGGTANGTNTGGDGTPPAAGDNLEFSGEIAATRCGITGVVACAPAGTNNGSHLVVSPRLSTGERTTPTTRKRFYVVISG